MATSLDLSGSSIVQAKPHSIYTRGEKWVIVCLAAFAGLFSPLTSSIYFPAIPTIAVAFHKSIELINLTITMYMVLQGVSPMVWGALSDRFGRRPIILACLSVLTLSCIGLALVPTSAYWLLMLLRCLQAAGSASTIALGAGIIGDISTPEERGGFFGFFTMGPMVGPAIGPVIGGVLSDRLGWRSIFWFLCIAASLCLVMMLLFLPETLRALVGDGSIILHGVYRPIIPLIGRKRHARTTRQTCQQAKAPCNPLRLLAYLDIQLLLGMNAIINAVFYGVLATISTLFHRAYPFLNGTTLGLCYLSIGGGMMIGSSVTGKVLDLEYRTFKKKVSHDAQVAEMQKGPSTVIFDFPVEQARLRLLPYLAAIAAVACAGYGWCLEKQVHIAVPIILQFIMGYAAISVMSSTSTLMIDLVPGQSSSVTACSNLVRCTFAAVVVSVIELIIDAIGTGWFYVILAALTVLVLPLVYLSIRLGPSCRFKRGHRQDGG
ncbi:hypothetical protein AX17_000331 [Amanita inopinata Kibby_2008]|nr:hypothetical protein AX17_000331 [Amanita inopinata Kibby_2008]